jgi:hypothetical protein
MARLSKEAIPEKLKISQLSNEYKSIEKHDKRVCFHTEPSVDDKKIDWLNNYRAWIKKILDPDKNEVFFELMSLPIETVDFTESVLKELRKVFEGQDRNISHNMVSKELVSDYNDYLKLIKDSEYWENQGFNAMRSNINAVMVVDLPELPVINGTFVQPTKYATPYYHMLDPCDVVNGEVRRDGQFEWILFKDRKVKDKYYLFDDAFYRTFIQDGDKIIDLKEFPHTLGYTPARTFWTTPFNKDSQWQRLSPISNSLGKLDWLLFLYCSKRHLITYAGFPIYIMYEKQCTYTEDGNACDGGRIKVTTKNGATVGSGTTTSWKECPRCSVRKILGAGTIMTAPAPTDKDDVDLIQGVNVVYADVDSIANLSAEIMSDEHKLSASIAGLVKEINEAAKNEKQVYSGFENRLTVIQWIKENFENIHKWCLDTMGRLRYGKSFSASTVSYGQKFYLYSFEDMIIELKDAKAAGVPVYEVNALIDELLAAKYSNNPELYQRYKILKELEPYVAFTLGELKALPGATDERLITLKKNFPEYISRFEGEFTDVVSFMPLQDMEQKIKFIRETLLSYVEDDRKVMLEQQKEQQAIMNPAPAGEPAFGGKPGNG